MRSGVRRGATKVAWVGWLALVAIAWAASPAKGDAIDDIVAQEMARRKTPGVALAVVHKGRVVKIAGYGLADVENEVPVGPDTVFQIQSITKTFTATAIMMLVEEGRLSLEDPVSKHLEGTPESWKPITLRHLLTHTSGIKDFINEPTGSLRMEVTEESVFKDTVPRPLNFEPGTRYAYSNTNYHLLVMIVRKLTGRHYGEFLKERVFEPLGMKDTRIYSWSELIPRRARGYLVRGNALRNGNFIAESVLAYGGGGIVSTAADLARWDVALRDGKVLPKEVLERMWTPAKLKDGKASHYGLGWATGNARGHRFAAHSGAHVTGFQTYHVRYLDDDLSVIVLTNSGSGDPARIAARVAGTFVAELAPPPPPATRPIEDRDPKVTELMRAVLAETAAGKLDASKYTPQMRSVLERQREPLMEHGAQRGALRKLDLVERGEGEGGHRWFRYRATFERQTLQVLLTVDAEGKVAGVRPEEE